MSKEINDKDNLNQEITNQKIAKATDDKILNQKDSNQEELLERYQNVIMQRDLYKKEAKGYGFEYNRQFGDLIIKVFEKKIDCIQKKKMIAYVQMAVNKNEKIDIEKINERIAVEMAEYNAQLSRQIKLVNISKSTDTISELELREVKKIYKEMVKLIHPDIHPAFEDNPLINDLWQDILEAYKGNDLERLKELKLLVNQTLKNLGLNNKDLKMEIPDIEGRIAKVLKEIDEIIKTEPYIFKDLLKDEDKTREKLEALEKEYKDYTDYEEQLDGILAESAKGGFEIKWKIE